MRKAISVTRRKASGKLQIHCYYELTLKGRPFKRMLVNLNLMDWMDQNCQADSSTKYATKYYHVELVHAPSYLCTDLACAQ